MAKGAPHGAPFSLAPDLRTAAGTRTGRGVGEWRSLVAHLLWEQRVAGSNPVSPTIPPRRQLRGSAFSFGARGLRSQMSADQPPTTSNWSQARAVSAP
jgi:hypothetical protein